MAKQEEMIFPRFVDRPGLFLMFESDEVVYSLAASSVVGAIILFSTANAFFVLLSFVFFVPFTLSIVREVKKKTGLPGALFYLMYAAGYEANLPMKKKDLFTRWPELKRMDTLDFVAFGFENEFLS